MVHIVILSIIINMLCVLLDLKHSYLKFQCFLTKYSHCHPFIKLWAKKHGWGGGWCVCPKMSSLGQSGLGASWFHYLLCLPNWVITFFKKHHFCGDSVCFVTWDFITSWVLLYFTSLPSRSCDGPCSRPILHIWKGRCISSCAHRKLSEVTPGQQKQNRTINQQKYNKKSPQARDLQSGRILLNNNPVPVQQNCSHCRENTGKKKLAHIWWRADRERVTPPNVPRHQQ